jgi:hypothetical protein
MARGLAGTWAVSWETGRLKLPLFSLLSSWQGGLLKLANFSRKLAPTSLSIYRIHDNSTSLSM